MELYQELDYEVRKLDQALKTLRNNGSALAKAEHDYKIAITQESLRLKDEGMSVALIQLTIYGIPSIAKLRMERDIASALYEANKEAINVEKLKIRIIEAQLQREWSVNE